MNITNLSEAREKEIRIQRYVESLEQVIQKNYKYMKSIMEDFQKKCRLATSTTAAPSGLFIEIADIYREIRKRLKKTQAGSGTPESEISSVCQKRARAR